MGAQPERRVLHKIIIYGTANIRSHESTWLFHKNVCISVLDIMGGRGDSFPVVLTLLSMVGNLAASPGILVLLEPPEELSLLD